MSTAQVRNYVIPAEGTFESSLFAKTITLVAVIGLLVGIWYVFLGVVNMLLAVVEFQDFARQVEVARQAYESRYTSFTNNPDNVGKTFTDFAFQPVKKDVNGNTTNIPLNPTFTLRKGIFIFLGGLIIIYIINSLYNKYGYKKVTVNEDGIEVSTFRLAFDRKSRSKFTFSPKKLFVWDGILDISVKKSDSIFAVLSSNVEKATVYTMDGAYVLEGLTVSGQTELFDRLRTFGDSLEERVIDFGYGAQLAVVWRRMKRSKVGVLGMFLVVFFIAVALISAVMMTIYPLTVLSAVSEEWTPFYFDIGSSRIGLRNPNFVDFSKKDLGPSGTYWFGTDTLGRDYFSRIWFGSFYSILIGFIAQIISTVLGGFIGAASGYLGGTFDNLIMRIADVLMVLPGIPILIMISASFSPLFATLDIEGAYYIVVFAIFSLIGWSGTARYVRAEVLAIKESEFIHAENVLGASHSRIIIRHIIPNTMSTMIIIFTLGVAGVIQSVAALAFLGFGSQSTLVWGDDLARVTQDPGLITANRWWGLTFISLALFFLTLGFNLMGDALRDALDPRLKE